MKKFIYAFKKLLGQTPNNLGPKWQIDTKSTILTTPIVAEVNNKNKTEIVFGTKEGKVFSLNDESQVKWIFDSSEKYDEVELMFLDNESANSIESTPNIADINDDGEKEIIFGSEQGKLYCIDNSGNLIWNFDAKSAIRGSPLLVDLVGDKHKEIIFGTHSGELFILSSRGEQITNFKIGSGIETKPLYVDKKIILSTDDGSIKCFNLQGHQIWSYKTEDKITADVICADLLNNGNKTLIIGSHDNKLYALTMDGELLWSYQTEGAIMSSVTVYDINKDHKKEIIFGSCDNSIYCLSSNGEKIWSYETDFWIVSTPLVRDIDNDGQVEIIAGSYDHNLYILDSEGAYMLNYMPGLSGVIDQTGHYSEIANNEAGKVIGKKLWQYKAGDMIIGCAMVNDGNEIIVNTKSGEVSGLHLTK